MSDPQTVADYKRLARLLQSARFASNLTLAEVRAAFAEWPKAEKEKLVSKHPGAIQFIA